MSTATAPKLDTLSIPLARYFSQLGYVVSDLDATVATLSKSLGVTFTRFSGKGDPSQVRYRGQPSDAAVEVAFADLNGIELEIIQPVTKGNIYTDFLDEHGPGLHHAGFKIPDHEQFRHYYDLLVANGSTPLMEGRVDGDLRVEFCYFDCTAFGASVIEITHFF